MEITNLTAKQLRRAAEIKDRIDALNAQLSRIEGSVETKTVTPTGRGRRRLSAAARARIAAAQKKRWAKQKGGSAKAPKTGRRTLSAATKAKMAAAAKKRWAQAKAQGKASL